MELKRRADFEAFLDRPGEARAALIHGPDLGLVRARGQRLAEAATERHDDPFNVAWLGDAELAAAPGRLEEELAAFSLLGGRRVVRLRLAGERGPAGAIALEALRRHLAGDLNPTCLLVIEAGVLRKADPLRSLVEKATGAVAIACYSNEAVDLARLTRQKLAQDQVGLATEALRRFVARLPAEHGVALAEIERLALFLGPGSGAVASDADLDAFLGVEPEASLGEAASHAFGGRAGPAFAELRRSERDGEAAPAAVRAFALHLGRLRRAGDAQATGRTLAEAVQGLQIFWKSKEEFTRQARAWRLPDLEAVQTQTFAAEDACRRTASPAWLIAERLSFAIAARASRLGL